MTSFVEDHPWILGILMLIGGPIVALCGKRWFPWVTAGIALVFSACFLLMILSVFGWMTTTAGLAICLTVTLLLALLAAWLVFKATWVGVGVCGVVGGYFLGTLIYTMFLTTFDFSSIYAMVGFSVFCAVVGGLVAWNFSHGVIIVATSGIGSYAFMRGGAFFLGGLPNESQMVSDLMAGQKIEVTWVFWAYMGVFIAGWIGATIWQTYIEKKTEDEDESGYNRQ